MDLDNHPSAALPSSSSPSSPPSSSSSLLLPLLSLGPGENLKRWSSFIGIVVAICGNILISLALNIQKYAHIRLRRESEKQRRLWKRRRRRWLRSQSEGSGGLVTPDSTDESSSSESPSPSPSGAATPDEASSLLGPQDNEEKDCPPPPSQLYLSSPYWWVGFILMSIGECGNFLAYGFTPASIVSPLGVVALVSNCVIAPVVLKEPLRKRDFIGVVTSILGAVIVVWSAEKEETKLGPDQILEAISQTAFEVYFGITCAMIIVLMYLSSRYGRKTILIDLGLVALFGGYTVLSTKGISSLLSSSFYHIFAYPIAYLFTTVLFLTAILQIKYVNRALQRFDSTQVIPTQFVLFTISVILGSAILYRDFETVKPERMTKFCTGCALTFWGVWLISSRRTERVWDDDDDVEDGYGATDSIDLSRSLDDGHEGRVGSVSLDDIPAIPEEPASEITTPNVGSKPMATRANSVPVLSTESQSRSGSYSASRPPSRLTSEPGEGSWRTTRMSAGGHRHSISGLLPGPIVAGYQLTAVVGDFATRRWDDAETGLEEVSHVHDAGRDAEGRRRSGSLGVVLDLFKRRESKGLEETEHEEE